MTRRRLRSFVLPSIYVITIAVIIAGISFVIKGLDNNSNYLFSTKVLKDKTVPVVNTEGEKKIIKPYNDEKVVISKSYYDITSDENTQQKSLIYYENTYMENTGVLYTSDEEFDVLAVLDGTIKDVKEDNILGTVVEIQHSNDLLTVYYSVKDVILKKGDAIKQGEALGKSTSNKLENEKDNCLLFEVYYKGNLINPIEFYNMNLNEL